MGLIKVELHFKRDNGGYLVADDETGTERWFDKKRYPQFEIDGDRLFVVVDETNWRRRMANVGAPKPATKTRKCIRCGNPFEAEKNQYVCSTCKSTATWRDGLTCFDV